MPLAADALEIKDRLARLRELAPAAAIEVEATWPLTLHGLTRPASETLLESNHGDMRKQLLAYIDDKIAKARATGHLPGVPPS